MPSTIALDHLIVLVPYAWVKEPPEWLTKHFTVTPGGTHSNGKTANILIIFKSGVYIEMIAFVDDRQDYMDGHWWGEKKYGWIDWALTYTDQTDFDGVMQRTGSLPRKGRKPNSLAYDEPAEGGRTKPDGTRIEWETTFPEAEVERGAVPFWCKDVTPRELRVPMDDSATSHPCKAAGIESISLILYSHSSDKTLATYSKIFSDSDHASDQNDISRKIWQVKQASDDRCTSIELQMIDREDEAEEEYGAGQAVLWEIVLYAEQGVEVPDDSHGLKLYDIGRGFDTSGLPHDRQKGLRPFDFYLEPWSKSETIKKRKEFSASPVEESRKDQKQSE